MHKLSTRFSRFLSGFLLLLISTITNSEELICEVGVYVNSHSEFVTITRGKDGYMYQDVAGNIGTIESHPSPFQCSENTLVWQMATWTKKPVKVINTIFKSENATLAGQLILVSGKQPKAPLVVYAHGSERDGWIESAMEPYQLVARNVSVFVYDKRGTGRSSGSYNQNFPTLSKDLIAAGKEAKRLAQGEFSRFGLIGLSQGGWVAPMASKELNADFLAVGYGLIANFAEEDVDQVMLELDAMEAGADIKSAAKQITEVTERLVRSNYQDGIEELILLRNEYGLEPWFKKIKGSYTGILLATDPRVLKSEGIPFLDNLQVDWSVDPIENVRNVTAEQYWALAEQDREAPIAKTLGRLMSLKQKGTNIKVIVFPNSDHGMRVVGENKVTEGYFDSQADFAKGVLGKDYGLGWEPQSNVLKE